MNIQLLRRNVGLIGILLVASILRLAYLGTVPAAISGDELLYPITAKSVILTGRDISGSWNPLSALLFRYPPGEHQAELPYFIHMASGSRLPFSLFVAKLPFALLSIGIVFLLYKIAELSLGKRTAVMTGVIASISPWLIAMGRTAYETTPSAFFYLLSLYLLLRLKSLKIYWTLVPLLLAFYSYIGTKLNFIPFTALSLVLAYTQNKHRHKQIYISIMGICVLFVILFVVLLHSIPGDSRMSEILLPNSPSVASQVDALRKSSIQSGMLPLFVNKYTVYAQTIALKLFRVFSPSYLFIEGDQFFLPVSHSFFYIVDSIFIMLGFLFLFSKQKRMFLIFLLYIFIGTMPQIFHKNAGDFAIHLTLMFPFLIIVIGYGIACTIENIPKKYTTATLLGIGAFYFINFGIFINTYFYQYPLQGSGDFHMRILSAYVTRATKNTKPITIYTTTSRDVLKKYLFYTNAMSEEGMPAITRLFMNASVIQFKNVTFASCDTRIKSAPESELLIYDEKCGMDIPTPHIQIVRLTDAGGIYNIYNDSFCSRFRLNPYPTGIAVADFNVESLSDERFCKTYFK